MNEKFIKKYMYDHDMSIIYNVVDDRYKVYQKGKLLCQATSYQYCLDYIIEVIIHDKYSNNR